MSVEVPALLAGRWFDGRSSRGRPVLVALARGARGPQLRLHATQGRCPLLAQFEGKAVDWPEPWPCVSARPRALVLELRGQGCLHLPDASAWEAAMAAAGAAPSIAQRLQARWPLLLATAAAAAALLLALYRWGLPRVAARVAHEVPAAWEQALSRQALAHLDGAWLLPSRLPADRQAALQARFEALLAHAGTPGSGYRPHWVLHWRRGLGANAFALPGGTVIVTDGLVQEADRLGLGDEAIAGVMAHEIGHGMHRHGTQLLVQQVVMAAGSTLVMGDVAGALTTAASTLAHLSYRREHEREADCYGRALMRRAGVPPQPLARLLARLDDKPRARLAGWLSTHPGTGERVQRLEESVESAGKPDSVHHGCP